MNYRHRIVLVSLSAIAVLGAVTSLWQRKLTEVVAGEQSDLGLGNLNGNLGQGLSLAVLGGYRSIAANVIWLEMNGSWERQEVDETITKIELATATDPRAVFFWINGSRIVANDIPFWVAQSQGINQETNPETMQALNRKFGEKALGMIDEALISHPGNVDLMVDRAVIYWKKFGELGKAAELFLEIANLPEGPYFAGRLYAEILVTNGEPEKALKYLKSIYGTLPDGDVQAMKPFVADRIRSLELDIQKKTNL